MASLVVGSVVGVFGVRGWVKIQSHTEPRDNILIYKPWLLERGGEVKEMAVAQGKVHGKGLIARLVGVEDRDSAAELVGSTISVRREQLAQLDEGEFYWADLIGLRVETVEGTELGQVDHLLETGSNDVLVLQGERERLVPFVVPDVVRSVDIAGGRIVVDWDPEF